LLATGCKPQKEVGPGTSIDLQVVDKTGDQVVGADVFLFEDLASFQKFSSDPINNGGYVQKTTTNLEGYAFFSNLKQINSYHFFVRKDNVNNVLGNYKMNILLDDNTNYKIKIVLQAVFSKRIKFFSTASSLIGNPLDIYLAYNGNPLTQTNTIGKISSPGDLDDNSIFYTPTTEGQYTFYVKNTNGCVWTKTLAITAAVSDYKVELAPCGEAMYTFNRGNNTQEIKVYLNNETMPIISLASGEPYKFTRPSGSYTYKAESADGKCSWIGTITETTPVTLGDCN
jgi:hypothetical protein